MANQIHNGREYIRISANKHDLEHSHDGKSWTRWTNFTEVWEFYDLITFQGDLIAAEKGHIMACSLNGSRIDRRCHNSYKIIKLQEGKDGTLRGYDIDGKEYISKNKGYRWDKFIPSVQTKPGNKPSVAPNRTISFTSNKIRKPLRSTKSQKKLGFWGNLFVWSFSFIGTIAFCVFIIWLIVVIFKAIF